MLTLNPKTNSASEESEGTFGCGCRCIDYVDARPLLLAVSYSYFLIVMNLILVCFLKTYPTIHQSTKMSILSKNFEGLQLKVIVRVGVTFLEQKLGNQIGQQLEEMLGKRKPSAKNISNPKDILAAALKKIPSSSNKPILMSAEIAKEQKDSNYHSGGKDKQKLSLAHRYITKIDRLPHQYCEMASSLKTLYLSNNFITELQNITQFQSLEHLSLANNNISQITSIRYLKVLKKLTHLSLEANPISKHHLYQTYAVGVSNGLRVLDQEQISRQMKENCIRNWDVYEEVMKDLLGNYMRLVYLFEFSKREAIHMIILQAGSRIQMVDPPPSIQNKIDFCLEQSEQNFQFLPIGFLIVLEEILYTDAVKLSVNGQCFISEEGIRSRCPIENFMGSMYQLLQKQRQKIIELRQKIISKYSPRDDQLNEFIPQRTAYFSEKDREEISDVAELMRGGWQGKRKQILYSEWKLMARTLRKLRLNAEEKRIKKLAAVSLKNILFDKASNILLEAVQKIKKEIVEKKIGKAISTIKKREKINLGRAWSQLKLISHQHNNQATILQKFNQKKHLRVIWKAWKKIASESRLQKENLILRRQLNTKEEREKKFIDKIKLLQKLLDITENKLQEYEGSQENLSILKSPKSLLHQLQSDISAYRCRSPTEQHPHLFRSPSPKAIKKNISKQNIQPNQFQQRKFNSSRKNIKLVENSDLF